MNISTKCNVSQLINARLAFNVLRNSLVRSASTSTPTDDVESCSTKKTKLRRAKTPIGKLDELDEGQHPYQEKEPLKPWPKATNPNTGEVGGPKGPEPTRYGDWERKGRVSDF